MVELETEEKQNSPQIESSNDIRIGKRILLISIATLIICSVGYFSIDGHWVEYVFAHLGGLSIIGLFGCCAGAISNKKGYGYWMAFILVMFLPLFIGTLAVLLFKPVSCGGSLSLAVAILIVTIYSIVKHSDSIKTNNA
jgi:hypothetical protein